MGSLDGPFVALLEQDGAYQACDGGFVREDAVDLGAALDLAVQALQRVGGVQLGSVLNREGHVGQHVGPRPVHQGGELRQLGAELVGGTPTPSAPAPLHGSDKRLGAWSSTGRPARGRLAVSREPGCLLCQDAALLAHPV